MAPVNGRREFSSEHDYSDEIAREIDDEIRRIVEEAHELAREILEEHRTKLDMTSEILLKRETIEREQFIELLEGSAHRLEPNGVPRSARVRPGPDSRGSRSCVDASTVTLRMGAGVGHFGH